MGNAPSEDWPVGPARDWVLLYNRYVFLVLALREFSRKGWPAGCLQDAVTDAAAAAVGAADRLRALGRCPDAGFVGEEAALWRRTVQYVYSLPWRTPPAGSPLAVLVEDARQVAAGWDRLVGFVWGLSDACFAQMPALQPGAFRPDGLAVLVGDGPVQPPAVDPVGQPAGEVADEPVVRRPA
jgi:hypothetical protein